jgi:hypothetical protein
VTAQLHADLVAVLTRHPLATRTNTPPHILASHMITSMQLFEASLLERAAHQFRGVGEGSKPDPAPGGLYQDRPGACPSCED